MFRGGDYVDRPEFREAAAKPGYDSLDIRDIAGAQPKRRQELRSSHKLGGAGAQIVDSHLMDAAGRNKLPPSQRGVSDVLDMGERYTPKQQRDALATRDINGGIKKNSWGQVVTLEDRLVHETAG